MVKGIVSYAAYVPSAALERVKIAEALGGRGVAGARAVASFDEDPITMAVAAVRALSVRENDGDPVYFATSSPPFFDKTNANIVKAAVGGDEWIMTVDLGGLRSGFAALSTAASTGGLAVMGDQWSGRPGSADELDGGDGAAAFVFGESDNPLATVLATTSVSMELMDVWRLPGADHPQVWEERFSQHVLTKAIREVVNQIGKDSDFTEAPTKTLIATPNRRFAASSAASIGSSGEDNVLSDHRHNIGYCGAADVGVLLAQALDTSRAGDTILVVSAAGSVDAMLLRVLQDGPGSSAWVSGLRERREISYTDYLTWRGLLEREPTRRPERAGVSAPPAARNAHWKFQLEGGKCTSCGKVYLPAERVCGGCGATDSFEPYSVSERIGEVAAISTDTVSDTPAPPAIAAMIDFDGGGRLMMEIAESTPDGTAVGDRVEVVFRRTYQVRGIPNYFWKARPVKGTAR